MSNHAEKEETADGRGGTRTRIGIHQGLMTDAVSLGDSPAPADLAEQASPGISKGCHGVTLDFPCFTPVDEHASIFGNCVRRSVLRQRIPLVYFVLEVGSGLVKIGWSAGVDKRLQLLRSERQRGDLALAAWLAGGRADEQQAHDYFADLAVGGEWFRPDQWMRDAIRLQRNGNVETCGLGCLTHRPGPSAVAIDRFLRGEAPDPDVKWPWFPRGPGRKRARSARRPTPTLRTPAEVAR